MLFFLTKRCLRFVTLALSTPAILFIGAVNANEFSVQVGAFSDKSAITVEKSLGINAGTVYTSNTSEIHRYYIGRYADRIEAEKNLKIIREKGFPDAFLAAFDTSTIKAIEPSETSHTPGTTTASTSLVQKPVLSVSRIQNIIDQLPESKRDQVVMIDGQLKLDDQGTYHDITLP